MNTYSKALFTVLLVGVVAGAFYLQSTNPSLLKGFIGAKAPAEEVVATEFADLKASLQIITPVDGEEDLKVEATIENAGKGPVLQGQPFKYTIFINDIDVFTNTDSYTSIEPGDSFSFVYPVPYSIYQYPSEGSVRFVIDPENTIQESNESNNEVAVKYNY